MPAPERDTQWISRLEELKVASLLVMEPWGRPMWSAGYSVQKLSLNQDMRSVAAGSRNLRPASRAVASAAFQERFQARSAWASGLISRV